MSAFNGPERRNGRKDRRDKKSDRRNDDRLLEDPLPRRNPDIPDRRNTPQ
ncbi:MAG: hypothetical protein V2I41_16880 [Pseudomonadales bacterium]|nr:hypothetical protein [Pseudomonadales bacterium]